MTSDAWVPPGEVGGDDERDVAGELVPRMLLAVEELTEPSGLAGRSVTFGAGTAPPSVPVAMGGVCGAGLARPELPVLSPVKALTLPVDVEGIRFPINPLFSLTLRPGGAPSPDRCPLKRGSRDGMRFPYRPLCGPDGPDPAGPAVPNGCLGASGAASGLLNFAMRSLSEPETARERSPPGARPAGELDRDVSLEPGLDLFISCRDSV
jgi:hypothetical protein